MVTKQQSGLLLAFLALAFSANAFSDEWITTSKLTGNGKTYYLSPGSLHVDDQDGQLQMGLKIIDIHTGLEFSDLKVTGCKKGTGLYKYTYAGDRWKSPKKWNRNGTQDFDKVSSMMCEIVADCKSAYASLLAKRKKGQDIESIEDKYFEHFHMSFAEEPCKKD